MIGTKNDLKLSETCRTSFPWFLATIGVGAG